MALSNSKIAPGRPFLTLLNYNLPYWRLYVSGTALSLVYVLVGLATPMIVRNVIAGFESGKITFTRLILFFCLLVLVALVTGMARYFERVLLIGASRHFEFDLRNDYFNHILSLSQDFFHRVKTGDIMARASNDLNYVRSFIGPGIMGTIDLLRLPFALGLMIYFSPRLTLIALLPLPVLSLFVYRIVMYSHHKSREVQEMFSDITSRVQENLAGARVVKSYGIADRECRAFETLSLDYMKEGVKLGVAMSLPWPLLGLMIGGMEVLVLWRGGNMVLDGALSLPNFSGFLVCLMLLAWPIAEFGWVASLYQRGLIGMSRILEVFEEEPTIRDDEVTDFGIQRIRGNIRFECVSFAYEGRPVLSDVSFELAQGQTLAIVGATGSGKSTIISLLTREYNPCAGTIYVDGYHLRRVPLGVLRRSIGYVPQDTFLFSESIRWNIVLGNPSADAVDVERACEIAQFQDTVSKLRDGLDTMLGERGINLSGGQKQRLTIARAVVRNPQILILDDALSSVDTHTEEQILQRLKHVMASRTTILISHRISAIRCADWIIVLHDGRIIEEGTHDDLLTIDGVYARMYERQLLEEELEEA